MGHKWEISNVRELLSWNSGEYLESPTFSLITNKFETEWAIHLYPNGIDKDNVGYLSIYLVNKSFVSEEDDMG